VGDEQLSGPADRNWVDPGRAGAAPPATTLPPRPPIVLHCDGGLVRAATRATLRGSLLGWQGLLLALLALVSGYAVVAGSGSTTWWRLGLAALGMYLLVVLVVARGAGRGMRRMLPVGRTVRSWYATPDALTVETGTGRTDLRPGSLQSARRCGPVTKVRLGRNRRQGFLPSALLTDEDLAFLVGAGRVGPAARVPPTTGLPLLLVATDRTRRTLRRAVLTWTLRRPQMVILVGCAVLLAAIGAWSHEWAQVVVAAVLLSYGALQVVGSVRLLSRSYQPGALVRAGLVEDRLRLQTGEDLVDELPLQSVRKCHVGRHHVRLDLGRGRPHLFLPRGLFPPTELADLQRRVGAR
jgi:hypothetical protein